MIITELTNKENVFLWQIVECIVTGDKIWWGHYSFYPENVKFLTVGETNKLLRQK
jgi:hypothetical protein